MSWDSYIDNLLGQSNNQADKAGIIGLDGGAPWTTSANKSNLNLQGQESANIAKCFKSKDFSAFMSGGVFIEGVKYQFLRVEDDKLVLGKKKDQGAVTLQASKTAIVMAHVKEGGQQGDVNKGVATIAEYLESMNM